MTTQERPHLIVITWDDIGGADTDLLAWESPFAVNTIPKVVTSVGWLLREGDEGITIATHFGASEEEQQPMYSGARVIPWDAIIERRELTVEDQDDDDGEGDDEEKEDESEPYTEEAYIIEVGDCPNCNRDSAELYAWGELKFCYDCLVLAKSGKYL